MVVPEAGIAEDSAIRRIPVWAGSAARAHRRTVVAGRASNTRPGASDREEQIMIRPRYRRSTVLAALAAFSLLPGAAATAGQQPGERGYRDESVMPEGVVGERIRALIATLNAGDSESLAAFLEEHVGGRFRSAVPMEAHEQAFAQTRRRWGTVSFHGIRTYDPPRPDDTIVIVRDSNFGAWRALSLRLDADDAYRIASLQFNDARAPTNVEEEALGPGDLVSEIDRLVTRSCELDLFSGTVLVADGEEVVYSHACGEASKRFHVPNRLDTKFNLGSMNKMFTSVAIMQLVERGTVSLDDPISKYVDESWLPREMTDRITIHHLLSHTSGLGSYFNDTYLHSSRAMFRALDDYRPLVEGETLAFEPGEGWRYSNTGMFLLGVVLENATGRDYFEYIRENIYEPAGMTDSDSYEMDQPVENLAIGYDMDPDAAQGYRNNLYMHVIKGGPAGGGFSTVEDLRRFASALLDGTLLSRQSLETMWTDQGGAGYGYGFSVQELPAGRTVGHSGGFPGINSNLDILLDRGVVVAVMSNYSGAASPIASGINTLIARTSAGAS
jgi:CubicO group peptidase (beta-lactamase class C family)